MRSFHLASASPKRQRLSRHAAARPRPESDTLGCYWSLPLDELLRRLATRAAGLTSAEAEERLERVGRNLLEERPPTSAGLALLEQLKNPLVLVLLMAAGVSAFMGEWVDSLVVLAIVVGSALLGFVQEWRATAAIEKLRARVAVQASVLRDGRPVRVPAHDVVPGDVALLSAGSLIPADGVLLEAKDFFVNQAVLTGETFPVEKAPGLAAEAAGLAARQNSVFLGTSVRGGSARVLITRTGAATEFGDVAAHLNLRPPETEFEQGVRHFGFLLTQIMFVLVLVVFAANVFARKPPIDSLLFAIALAVGMTPELLPAIITITLARGARDMAARGVIVRRLNAIENFGGMDILCTDKTGTLTQGSVRLESALDGLGQASAEVLRLARQNAQFQTGLANPLDEAILATAPKPAEPEPDATKVDEIPYDFVRKRLSVVVEQGGRRRLISKGAPRNVLDVCTAVRDAGLERPLTPADRQGLLDRFAGWGREGFRALGVATREAPEQAVYGRADERELVFEGFLLFVDPPKPGVGRVIEELLGLGVSVKMISGDSREVALHLARQVGLPADSALTGAELNGMHDEALWHAAERTSVFAEVDPNQKERIILALRKTGHVVGYMGDGINDAPALHSADVGISVEGAVDIAKEAADLVLVSQDLDVLKAGIEAGRITFANTLKYVFTTTSANFGNMFSMAGASLLLPFLPLLAPQILLNNFLSDVPAMAIAGDGVDPELVRRPHRWDIRTIRNFMIVFGLISSVFDYLTFGVLLLVARATPAVFHTAWFVESLLTELAVALVVRTSRPFYRSRPSNLLLGLTLGVAAAAPILPYTRLGELLGFVPLTPGLMSLLLGITAAYVLAVEAGKRRLMPWSG